MILQNKVSFFVKVVTFWVNHRCAIKAVQLLLDMKFDSKLAFSKYLGSAFITPGNIFPDGYTFGI
jgi:hypothetical protein